MLAEADLILVMTSAQAAQARRLLRAPSPSIEYLGDFDPQLFVPRDIPDPYGQSDNIFVRVFDRIDRCLAALTAAWGS